MKSVSRVGSVLRIGIERWIQSDILDMLKDCVEEKVS
jgi:hypothetical protein